MCVDGGGNICACDFRNNRLSLLSPTGKLLGHSLTGLSKPQYIAMNHNRLFSLDMGRSTSYRYIYVGITIPSLQLRLAIMQASIANQPISSRRDTYCSISRCNYTAGELSLTSITQKS